ncbi:MAG: DUF3325 family protein [Parahaliea sp.]
MLCVPGLTLLAAATSKRQRNLFEQAPSARTRRLFRWTGWCPLALCSPAAGSPRTSRTWRPQRTAVTMTRPARHRHRVTNAPAAGATDRAG